MNNKRVELLAPAGNIEGFYGAMNAGADAVYLAGEKFGARAYAENFTTEQIVECIRYAHLFDRKVYLTVNTLIKEKEFDELYDYLVPFYEEGLDAVIVQDIGVFQFIKERFPGLVLHVSTQMTITGVHGASLLQKMGAERIVPARELSLPEIKKIKEQTCMELECFIHGAMCYCYSGQCLFSSILGGRSGNRGRCAQPCRLPYSVEGIKTGHKECYPLSLKDMCTIEHIDKLIEAGIDSFKIEGRMKKPEYTAGVTAIYRKYIDAYYKCGHSVKVSDEDMKVLTSLYIRSERETGYYFRHNGSEMVSLYNPSYGKSDELLIEKIRSMYLEQRMKCKIKMQAQFQLYKSAQLTVSSDNVSISVCGPIVERAQKQPVTKENIHKQLNKLGDSNFVSDDIRIIADEDIFIPLKAINELRREAVLLLERELIEQNRTIEKPVYNGEGYYEYIHKSHDAAKNMFTISVETMEQLKAVIAFLEDNKALSVKKLYVNGDLLMDDKVLSFVLEHPSKHSYIVKMPYIIRERDASYLAEIFQLVNQYPQVLKGFLVPSPEALGYLLEQKYEGEIYGDAGLYMWNHYAVDCFYDIFDGYCLPYELKGSEKQNLLNHKELPFEQVVYGRIPMMITANCISRTTGMGCGEKTIHLTDRYNKRFPVKTVCSHCMNIIYNSVPLSLHNVVMNKKERLNYRMNFTLENAKEVLEILSYFTLLYNNNSTEHTQKPPYEEYTTGHEKRGVE